MVTLRNVLPCRVEVGLGVCIEESSESTTIEVVWIQSIMICIGGNVSLGQRNLLSMGIEELQL